MLYNFIVDEIAIAQNKIKYLGQYDDKILITIFHIDILYQTFRT